MGPLELTDLIGLDTGLSYNVCPPSDWILNSFSIIAKAIGDGWRSRAEAGDERLSKDFLRPIRLMDELVSEGKLGVKTGQGIYKY
jgi:3-hydroxyacyl-CoA dehydrogenase